MVHATASGLLLRIIVAYFEVACTECFELLLLSGVSNAKISFSSKRGGEEDEEDIGYPKRSD